MKVKSKVVGALALATAIAALGGSTAGAVTPPSAAVVTPTQQYTGTGATPVHGDFDGDGRSDIFWYVPGSGTDTLWSGKSRDNTSGTTTNDRFATQTLNISGTYTPVAGDFNGDGRTDIFWYGTGSNADSIWYFTGRGTVSSKTASIGGTYKPLVANFDSSGSNTTDDIFWSSSDGSYLWSGNANSTFTSRSFTVKPPKNAKAYVNNFRQSSNLAGAAVHQDILFYVPGSAADTIWVGDGTGAFTQSAVTINGSYEPIIGNFDTTASTFPKTADIFWYAPGKATDSIWMNNGAGFANTLQIISGVPKPVVVNGASYKPVVIPAKTDGQPDDILWNNPAGSGETIWNMSGASLSFAYNVVNLSQFGGTDPGTRNPIVGDFDLMDAVTNAPGRISAGEAHTCALTPKGGVQCWGANGSGQLGNGTTTDSTTPVDVTGLQSGVVAVASGGLHTCALTTTATVKCWGINNFGQLGNGTTTNSLVPVTVSGLTDVASLELGWAHSCAITTGGGARCWGANNYGQLGIGSLVNSNVPVTPTGLTSNVTTISLGFTHTCATVSGSARCFGASDSGGVGNGGTANVTSPTTVIASGVSSVSATQQASCAVMTAGGVKCWGSDSFGQQGNGSASSANVLSPADVSGLSGITSLTMNSFSVCARTSVGAGKCWGGNTYGEFGNGTTTGSTSPVDVAVSTGHATTTAGGNHTCTLSPTGVARCWGQNHLGQVGSGTPGASVTAATAVPGIFYNVDSPYNPANTDIFFWAAGNGDGQSEILWQELEAIA